MTALRALGAGLVLFCLVSVCLPPPQSPAAWQATVRVSHYWSTGNPMADGQMPFVGAVACSSDIGFGSTVITPDGQAWQCLDTGALDGWGFSRTDFYGFDAESVYGDWLTVTVEP